jgi:flagellar hook-associated protein FlgK
MNAERLLQVVEFLIEQEKRHQIQSKLNELNAALQNLSNQPQQAHYQTQVAANLDSFEKSLHDFYDPLSPAQIYSLADVEGAAFFLRIGLTDILYQG